MKAGSRNFRLGAVYFFLFAPYGVSTPYLQVLLRGLGYGPAALGLLLGIFEVAGITGPLLVARAADRRGLYRPALLGSALLAAAAALPLALLPGLPAAILSLALLSVGLKSVVPLMDAAVFAFAAEDARAGGAAAPSAGKAYGGLRSVGTVGFVAVVLLLQATRLERRGPLAIALWISGTALAFALSLLLMPERPGRPGPAREERRAGRRRLDPVLALGLLVIALGRIAMAPISSFFTLYVTEELRSGAAGLLWALSAGSEIPLLILSGAIIARLGPMRSIALATLAIVARLLVYALFPSVAGAAAGQLLHSLCYGLFHPAAVAFVALRVPPERRAEGMALYMGLGVGLPAFLGSALGGLVLEAAGYRLLFASFTAAALAALGLYAATRRRFGEAAFFRSSAGRAWPWGEANQRINAGGAGGSVEAEKERDGEGVE